MCILFRLVPVGCAVVACWLLGGSQLLASDIGGEVEPPPCEFDDTGRPLEGYPFACAGPMTISLFSGGTGLFTSLDSVGNQADPWVITHVMEDTEAVMKLSGGFGPVRPFPGGADDRGRGNPTPSLHWFARFFALTVVNSTSLAWSGFELELHETPNVPSHDEDNISFGQTEISALYYIPSSNVFRTLSCDADSCEASSRDIITFGGLLRPGEAATMYFLISDNGPTMDFYLSETATVVPEPGTFLICALGAAAMCAGRLRRRSG